MSSALLADLLAARIPEPSAIWLHIDLPVWMTLLFLFWLGAICGSFLNVCVYRLPQYPHGQFWPALCGLWSPPSSCPRCRTFIAWYDNIPVLGWLRLGGRCRTCHRWISPQYPIIEFLNGLLFVGLYWLEVPTGLRAALEESCLYTPLGPQTYPGLGGLSPEWWVHLRFAYHVVLVEALLCASLIDLRLMIIPDTVTLPAMLVGVVGAVAIGRLNILPVWFQEPHLARDFSFIGPTWMQWMVWDAPAVPTWVSAYPHLHGLAASLAGLAAGGLLTGLVRVIGSWGLQREAMGDGDVVLMAMVGSFIGWQPVVMAFFIAPLFVFLAYLARMTFRLTDEIPYGPYLSLGVLATLAGWKWLWPSFERAFSLGPLLIPFFLMGVVIFTLLLMMIQGAKRLLGIPLAPAEEPGVWTAADQTVFFAGEKVDRHTNLWAQSHEWPGQAAGRGSRFEERWKSGTGDARWRK